MFNNRVCHYRLSAILVLAVLVLIGLGAGHHGTRALGAGGSTPASALFADGAAYGLQSDGRGVYVDGSECVANYSLSTGLWRLQTPVHTCSAVRKFKLVLSATGGCVAIPDPAFGGDPLNLCGSNDVWGQVEAISLFSNGPNRGTGMVVYIRTDPPSYDRYNYGFELDYEDYLSIIINRDPKTGKEISRTVTTDNASPWADLYQIVPVNGGWGKGPLVGQFNVPCKITVTQHP